MEKSFKNLDNILTNIGYGKYQIAVFIASISTSFSQGCEFILMNFFQEYLIDHLDYNTTLATILVSIVSFGQLSGVFVTYILGDNYGRLFILKISLIVTFVFGVLSAVITNNVIVFVVLRTLSDFGVGLSTSNTIAYAIENSPNYNRGLFSISYLFFGILSQTFAFIVAFTFMREVDGSNWELTFGLNYSICLISAMPMFFFLEESPWFLIKRNKTEECINVVNKISSTNTGVGLTEDEKESIRIIELDESSNSSAIFDRDHIRKTLAFIWLTTYTSIAIGWSHFLIPMAVDGTEYFIVTTIALCVITSFFIVSSFIIEMHIFGRRYSSLLLLSFMAIVSSIGIFMSLNEYQIGIFIAVVYGISYNTYIILRLFIAEVYEADIRTSTLSIVYLCSRIHMIYFPIIYVLITEDTKYSLVVFSVGGIISCLLIFTISQDSLGKHLEYKYN